MNIDCRVNSASRSLRTSANSGGHQWGGIHHCVYLPGLLNTREQQSEGGKKWAGVSFLHLPLWFCPGWRDSSGRTNKETYIEPRIFRLKPSGFYVWAATHSDVRTGKKQLHNSCTILGTCGAHAWIPELGRWRQNHWRWLANQSSLIQKPEVPVRDQFTHTHTQ